jgi:hypothetical protein
VTEQALSDSKGIGRTPECDGTAKLSGFFKSWDTGGSVDKVGQFG